LIKSRGSRIREGFKVWFGFEERDLVVSTKSSRVLHVNQLLDIFHIQHESHKIVMGMNNVILGLRQLNMDHITKLVGGSWVVVE
jgi:hypothetical protein